MGSRDNPSSLASKNLRSQLEPKTDHGLSRYTTRPRSLFLGPRYGNHPRSHHIAGDIDVETPYGLHSP
ncbi:hypothetical protein CBS63078_2249 [Aspergillus niger]|nr:hypothetical protein CBS115989_8449 [Aspergillus niger]KAI2832049.1 hypothetical protein CBS133816_1926 [Aspergillus niger]KAI2844300.1 hypothetical protein CBS11350_4731 [Aspergillus niger]KAI2853213.1 hypothetical protein CBS11232_5488 [Aspergillus niger]KAI2864944.1 hypothetical protein CBS12448_2571 [Aspergillus niger]